MISGKPTHENDHPHGHNHPHERAGEQESEGHGHSHGTIDPSVLTTARGIYAVKWSFLLLFITALFQIIVVWFTGSVALLADTIHNVGDAATAIPLWIASRLARWKPSRKFTYGYGRVEDLAGVAVVLTILISALVAGYESINRFFHPQEVTYLWAVVAASIIGFLGNEAVALFRIKVGEEIGSAALVADGYHARVDGFTSLAVLFGALGVWLGYPLADPLIGLLITLAIFKIVWDSAKAVFTRLLDGVDPKTTDEIKEYASQTPHVDGVTEVRVRWLGHRLQAELNVAVQPQLSVAEAHAIAVAVEQNLLEKLCYLSKAVVHVDPVNKSGERHHQPSLQAHENESDHSH